MSLSGSFANVTFRSNGCKLVYLLFSGNTMLNPDGGVLATVIIVSLVLKLLKVSLTMAVKLITLPLVTFMVMF